jgi:hypothetical protein
MVDPEPRRPDFTTPSSSPTHVTFRIHRSVDITQAVANTGHT